MALITQQPRQVVAGRSFLIEWLLMDTSDNGNPLELPGAADKTVQIDGTFDAGTVATLQGSNDGDSWFSLTDPQGNDIALTAGGLETIMENPRFIRPIVAGGTSPSVNFRVLSRSTKA